LYFASDEHVAHDNGQLDWLRRPLLSAAGTNNRLNHGPSTVPVNIRTTWDEPESGYGDSGGPGGGILTAVTLTVHPSQLTRSNTGVLRHARHQRQGPYYASDYSSRRQITRAVHTSDKGGETFGIRQHPPVSGNIDQVELYGPTEGNDAS